MGDGRDKVISATAVAGIQGDADNGLTYSNSAPNLITGRHVRIVPSAN